MNKQLMTILKKRYGLALIVVCSSIILFYGFSGISDVNRWKEINAYYDSEEFINELNRSPEEYGSEYKQLPAEKRHKTYKEENLKLFYQAESYDEYGKPMDNSNQPHYTGYFSENFVLLFAVVSMIGFGLFFIDLKTSFNEFLFSLGVSKKQIYFSKFALIAIPVLGSVLLAKMLLVAIIITGIPAEYINIDMIQLMFGVVASWTTVILYFSLSAFIGLITGHILLAPLTAFGFCGSFVFFATAVVNMWNYYIDGVTYNYLASPHFIYSITKEPISVLPIILAVLLSFFLFIFGAFLFSSLTLEKKGNYLLFDKLKLPVIIAMTLYVPIVLVFGRGWYFGEENRSPIPSLLTYGLITVLIGIYVVYRKEIHLWLNKRKVKKVVSTNL
ncbi:ABC transporter permease [Candidatus Enterococcus mansonii]|uniref:ABC transporter permease n=1 Tax=Candidatus Enterococcus mansonii TaxID=1834181 RepID=A0A242CJW4_9ENTE|nr:ABC transporter permease [Enterococcus sp. 4G2_DIV0659]OTO10544.1 hypothetical protein A5880_001228 [Enterococcus sp. 4G2_DIV0659]